MNEASAPLAPALRYQLRFAYVCPGCRKVLLAGVFPFSDDEARRDWGRDFPASAFTTLETSAGSVAVSLVHMHGNHPRALACPYVFPRGIDLPAPDPAGELYRTLYRLAFHGEPTAKIMAFDVAKFLALPCWLWVPDTCGQGAPLALAPATGEGLALCLLLGEEPALLDIDPYRTQLQQMTLAFPSRIGATLG